MIRRIISNFLRKASMPWSQALNTLGFPSGSTPDLSEVTRAWKEKVKLHHPDRGGDLAMMQNVNLAFDILKGKTRAAPEPAARPSGPSYSEPRQKSYQQPPDPRQKQRESQKIPFDSVVPPPPPGIQWLFVTAPISSSGDQVEYEGYEKKSSSFALVGKSGPTAYVWVFTHWKDTQNLPYKDVERDVWDCLNVKFPAISLTKTNFAATLLKLIEGGYKAVLPGAGRMSRMRGVWPADILPDKPTLASIQRATMGKPVPLRDYLDVLAGRQVKLKPKATIIRAEYSRDMMRNQEKVTIWVNNEAYVLSDDELQSLKQTLTLRLIFGEYYYDGDIRVINKLKDRKTIYRRLSRLSSLTWRVQQLMAEKAEEP